MRDAFDITIIIIGAIIGCLAGGAMATELLYAFVKRVMPELRTDTSGHHAHSRGRSRWAVSRRGRCPSLDLWEMTPYRGRQDISLCWRIPAGAFHAGETYVLP